MNILWLTNIPVPEASLLMNDASIPFGGWLVNTSIALSKAEDIRLSIAFPKKEINKVINLVGEKINYFAFSVISNKNIYSGYINAQLIDILDKVKPDIVHIFGTEYAHTLAMVKVCDEKNIKSVISIQGLVHIYARHYMLSVPCSIQRKFTIRDIIKQDNLIQQQRKFFKRGKFEIEAILKAQNIIGRTTWDKACIMQINPNANYYLCNETLREEFYKHIWDIKSIDKFSIFMSQASYPIKGLHLMIEALKLVLIKFPDAKLYIAGYDITKEDTFGEKLKITSYAKYIIKLIKKYNLKEKIIFTGLLNEKQMCERYIKSNVFVCPSSIENSPNSLGEAMLLGVPCVASSVGGVPDLLVHKKDGFLYQADASYMLAYYVCEIFNNEELALEFSQNARKHALKTHNPEDNMNTLRNIYNAIYGKEEGLK